LKNNNINFDKLKSLDEKIISYVIQEKTSSEIASLTGVSVPYVKKRLVTLFKRYNVKSKVGLVREMCYKNIGNIPLD
jgi:DNA-binding CsgD family transcriptional regulator